MVRRTARWLGFVMAAAVAPGCTGDDGDSGTRLRPSDDGRQAAALVDTAPDPNLVEVTLIAGPSQTTYLPGKPADVWAYRDGSGSAPGTVPGPTLEAKLGDRIVVHFKNQLAHETTVHWHGLRLANAADGTTASQIPVPPGGTYTYEFVAQDAGTFWYHPHMHADEQIERGLYGAVRIRGGVEPEVAADRIFIVDDVKLEATGKLTTQTDALDLMLGRLGNVLLINGGRKPTVAVRAGTRERWRFVNAANGRYFNLSLDGRPFLVIGWDGGVIATPYTTDKLLIAPGERYEVLVTFAADDNRPLALRTLHHDRGHNVPDPGPLELMQVKVMAASPGAALPPLPTSWGQWQPLPVDASTRRRAFTLSEQEEPGKDPKFFINDEAFPTITPVRAVEGDVEIWEITNKAEMDHPFHLHGMFFQVLDRDGVAPEHLGDKDTVNIAKESSLRFAVRYGPPGAWMFHCHILEHAERGMMGELKIEPR
jgi:FtsP/CotA-like multicopper oxidase with cupredoxin domain